MEIKTYLQIPMLIVVFAMFSSCSQRTDLTMYGLHGKVKTYTEREYKAEKVADEWVKGEIREGYHHRSFFDSEGNLEMREILMKDDSVLQKIVVKKVNDKTTEEIMYDSDGAVVEKVIINHISTNEMEYICTGKNEEKKNEAKLWMENGKCKRQEIQFYENDEKSKEYSVTLEYDENGNLSTHKQRDKKSGAVYTKTYTYFDFDDHNNWIKKFSYYFNDKERPSKIVIRAYEYY